MVGSKNGDSKNGGFTPPSSHLRPSVYLRLVTSFPSLTSVKYILHASVPRWSRAVRDPRFLCAFAFKPQYLRLPIRVHPRNPRSKFLIPVFALLAFAFPLCSLRFVEPARPDLSAPLQIHYGHRCCIPSTAPVHGFDKLSQAFQLG